MENRTVTDQELVNSYIAGNRQSLETIIRRHRKRVYAYIYMLVKDHQLAEDLFQDTFMKVIHKLKSGKYNEEGKFLQWVMRIAHNLIIDHFRREKRITMIGPTDEFDIFNTIKTYDLPYEHTIMKEQLHKQLRSLIELLPPEQKEVLKMRHYQEMSFKEIAEETDVSINTALGRMRYALINLRKMIEQKSLVFSL
ncbi:MAG: sigma-70 family RNA polymerase sigma factor [Bacteroidales bacterium]